MEDQFSDKNGEEKGFQSKRSIKSEAWTGLVLDRLVF